VQNRGGYGNRGYDCAVDGSAGVGVETRLKMVTDSQGHHNPKDREPRAFSVYKRKGIHTDT